jgi:signal peptide peptidase SppA
MNHANRLAWASQPWAMCPVWLDAFLQSQIRHEKNAAPTFSSEAQLPLAKGYPVALNHSSHPASSHAIAVLPITGIILPYTDACAGLFDATYLDQLRAAFDAALASPAIQAIVFTIDSPGGAVTGVNAFANHIASARGQKPIMSFIAGMGASAAYWIASATDDIIVDATASVGSIGVVSVQYDNRLQQEKAGIQEITIVSSVSPRKRPDILTDAGKADIQTRVDRIADVFVDSIARHRHIARETILSDFGQGGVLIGVDAVSANMVDRVGSFESLIHTLTSSLSSVPSLPLLASELLLPRKDPMNEIPETTQAMLTPTVASETMNPLITLDRLTADYPALIQAIQEQGAMKERERIQSVEAQLIAGHDALIEALKWDGKTTGQEAALHVVAAEKAQRQQLLQQLKMDAPAPVSMPAILYQEAAIHSVEALSESEKYHAEWRTNAALRDEFQSEAAFIAYRKAEANNQVHVLRTVT